MTGLHFRTSIRTLFLGLLILTNAYAQDSVRISSSLSIETKGQHILSAFANNFDCFNCIGNRIADNPFHHLAIYTGIDHTLKINNKYTLETGLYLEERSHSHGNNTLENLVIYPRIKLEARDTITIGREKLRVHIKGGDFWNEDVDDILRLYNIDYQGLIGSLHYRKWSASFFTIGDLSRNIGLDLHQLYRFSLGYSNRGWKSILSVSFNELLERPRGFHSQPLDANISSYTQYQITPSLTVRGQAEVRINPDIDPSAALAIQGKWKPTFLTMTGALRFYQQEYNHGYNGDGPRYAGGVDGFIGPQLYPLRNYYRNFSQWAVFTHLPRREMLSLEWGLKWDHLLYKKLGVFADLDYNHIIDIERNDHFIYPIYNAGIEVRFSKYFIGQCSVTNKHMELRNRYQTVSVSKSPFMSLGIILEIEDLKLGEVVR